MRENMRCMTGMTGMSDNHSKPMIKAFEGTQAIDVSIDDSIRFAITECLIDAIHGLWQQFDCSQHFQHFRHFGSKSHST